MADVNQLTAAAGIIAAQEQENQKRKQLEADIAARTSLLAAKTQESQQNSEISSAVKQYEGLAKQEADLSGVLERGFKPGGFYRGAKPISDEERLVYMQKLQGVQQQKEAIASSLKGYLQPEPEKPRQASELKVPQQAPLSPQPAKAAGKAEDVIPVVKAERLTPFDEFNIINQRRQQFIEDSMNDIASLPRGLRDRGMKLVKELADQSFKLPDNVARPVIDAATGQVIPGWRKVGDRLEKMESGKDTDKEEERMRELGVPGVGIARTVQEAKDLRAAQASKKSADSMIDRLIEIANKPGAAFNPKDRAEADQISTLLEGAMRVQILGPGAVTEPDRQVLKSTIANPAQIFRFKDNVLNALNNLKRVNQQNLENQYESGIYKRFEQPQGQQQQQGGQGGGGRMIYDYTSKKFIQPK